MERRRRDAACAFLGFGPGIVSGLGMGLPLPWNSHCHFMRSAGIIRGKQAEMSWAEGRW